MGDEAIVVVFRLGETLVLDVAGTGSPVAAVKILPNGVNRAYCCTRKKEERLTLFVDVVVPLQN